MDKYRTMHAWMIVPMIFMQLGIYRDYWGDFTANAWSVHIHYWTGTAWYIYLIIQPYLITHGHVERHRTNGMVGMFLAGGVCLTALSMMHRDIATAGRIAAAPEKFGPFQPWFFFGVAVEEIVMMTAFGFAVIKGIQSRKEFENHAWWLISTVFIIMMPALGRGIQNAYVGMHLGEWPNINIILPIHVSVALIIAMLLLGAWKYHKLRHPATWLAAGVNLFIFLLEPLGKSEGLQEFFRTVIKG